RVTRFMETLAHRLDKRPISSLVINNSDPRRHTVRVNGIHYPAASSLYEAFDPWISGCSVETFEGERRIEGIHLSLQPGLGIELNVDYGDGHLAIEYEGPIRSPVPSRRWPGGNPIARDRGGLPLNAELHGDRGLLAYAHHGRYLIVAGRKVRV